MPAIELIVPFPADGVTDLVARRFAHARSAPQAHRIGTSGAVARRSSRWPDCWTPAASTSRRGGTVTFHGGAAILEAVITRQTDFAAQYVAEMGPLLADARLRALAVSGQSRTAALPEVPTAAECGFAGFDLLGWTGVVGPPGLPAAIVERWQAAVQAVAAGPEFRAEIEALGGSVAWRDHIDFRQALAAEYAIARDTVERLGLRR